MLFLAGTLLGGKGGEKGKKTGPGASKTKKTNKGHTREKGRLAPVAEFDEREAIEKGSNHAQLQWEWVENRRVWGKGGKGKIGQSAVRLQNKGGD